MTREELIKKVALKMDEISSSDDIIVSVHSGDNNPLYTQIDSLLNESVNEVLMKAALSRLQGHIVSLSSSRPISILDGSRTSAVFAVPEDFLRLVSINDTAFQRPITSLAIEGDDTDKMQHNKFLVAKYAKPVAVIGNIASRGRVVTCYSYEKTAKPNPTMLYIARYDKGSDVLEDAGLDGYLTDIVSWVCAGKVFAAQGDIDKGKLCDENAVALMI